MDDPDWLKVLRVYYEENISYETDPTGSVPSSLENHHKLEDVKDVTKEIQKLHTTGLLEINEEYIPQFDTTGTFTSISQKGFEVVYEHDLRVSQSRNNSVVAGLTIVLALTAVIQTVTGLFSPNSEIQFVLLSLLIIALVPVFLYLKPQFEWPN